MDSADKRSPGARGVPQPFNRQAGHAPQTKPAVAQLKIAAPARSVGRPAAPPAYRPQPVPKVLQTKKAVGQQVAHKQPSANVAAQGAGAAVQRAKKGGKGAREQQKQLRKKVHQMVDQGKLTSDKMWATAMCGKDSVSAESGTAPGTESARIDKYIDTKNNWPWTGKPEQVVIGETKDGEPITRKHKSCAEAHVYALLIEAGKNPKSYTLKSYNSKGKLAPPCLNCKTWVGAAFKSVEGLNATYRSGSTGNPNWAAAG